MEIGVVLVTFNRLEKLRIALECYEEQSFKPKYLLVVDNCSTDGTQEFLTEWKAQQGGFPRKTLFLEQNTGGAGGFYAGMETALTLDADWIWLSDDDAYPRLDALLNLRRYYEALSEQERFSVTALCAAVYNGGKIHCQHRNHLTVTKWKCMIIPSRLEEYEQEAFPVEIFSYVGAVIRKDMLCKVGLDRKEFFIYCDDQEHSLRLSRAGKLLCVPSCIVDHDTPPFDNHMVNWGRYYKKRNDLLMIRGNFPFRYFLFRFVRRYLSDVSVFSKNDPELKKVLKEAYRDAWRNKAGLHAVYRPGWKSQI